MELHRRRGAPNGNQNRLRHGRYTAAALAQRKLVRQMIHSARVALAVAAVELQFDRVNRLPRYCAPEKP